MGSNLTVVESPNIPVVDPPGIPLVSSSRVY